MNFVYTRVEEAPLKFPRNIESKMFRNTSDVMNYLEEDVSNTIGDPFYIMMYNQDGDYVGTAFREIIDGEIEFSG